MYPYPPAAPHKQHQPTRQLPDYIHHARTSKRIGCAQPPAPRPISPVWRCFCRPGAPKNHPGTPNRVLGAIKPVKQAKNHRKIDRSLLEKLTLNACVLCIYNKKTKQKQNKNNKSNIHLCCVLSVSMPCSCVIEQARP